MSEIDLDRYLVAYHKDKITKTFPERFFNPFVEGKRIKYIVRIYRGDLFLTEMYIKTIDELEMIARTECLKDCQLKIKFVSANDDGKVLVNKQNGNYREPAIVLEKEFFLMEKNITGLKVFNILQKKNG